MEKIVLYAIIIAVVALAVYLIISGNLAQTVGGLFDALRTCRICPSFQLPS